MALEIPAIMSPVGVNNEIINHGENGMLADSDQEWIDCLSQLIDSKYLRCQLGSQGRESVEQQYSVTANMSNYLEIFQDLE